MANDSVNNQRQATRPLTVQRTTRGISIRNLTSLPSGRMVPLAAFGLLREDAISASRIQFGFEMMETAELLVNPINVRVYAWLVPFLAFDRFGGSMDALNKSYMGQPAIAGQPVTPFLETAVWPDQSTNVKTNEIFYYLGKHGKAGSSYNTAYLEAYNEIWNFRATQRSPDLTLRGRLLATLAPAFWVHEQFGQVVPEFQQSIIDGVVPLNVVQARMPVQGIGLTNATGGPVQISAWTTDSPAVRNGPGYNVKAAASVAGDATMGVFTKVGGTGSKDIDVFAELAENGITVSLSNIELARKTQAFALLRQQYTGHTDEWLIDLLMSGVSVPDQDLKQPILLGQRNTIFGMSKRYASDGANLTESVVNGLTTLDMMITTPKINTGGVVMICAEILPEQLWERQQDVFLHSTTVDMLPEYLRDTLDPEKVEIVQNSMIDTAHATPTGVFGYAPLSWRWNAHPPGIGGKFYRPSATTAFDEDRQRIWAVETENPTLSESFYISTNIHNKPFVVEDQDPFECTTRGELRITGNTVFGPRLVEGSGDYEAILAEAPLDRIDQVATTEEGEMKALPNKVAPEGNK